MNFKLTNLEKLGILKFFENYYGQDSEDFRIVLLMDDIQLCQHWSKKFC